MDLEGIQAAVELFLRSVGVDPAQGDLALTPERVTQACPELFQGVGQDPLEGFEVIEGPNEPVALRGIWFMSFCEHHLLPFHGHVDVLILPEGGRIAGLGTMARVVHRITRRLQLQEKLTQEIADALQEALGARGVLVRSRAYHLCLAARSEREIDATVVAMASRGALQSDEARGWAMALLASPER